MADGRNPTPTRGSRREQALFDDAIDWAESLENDAHWARSPESRAKLSDRADILRSLIRAAGGSGSRPSGRSGGC